MIEQWLKEYLESGLGTLRRGDGYEFIIHRGFKIIKSDEGYSILDVRYNDFYTNVTKKDYSILEKHGFILGTDLLMKRRDKIRALKHRTHVERLHSKRDKIRMEKDDMKKSDYLKALQKVNDTLRFHLDKLFLYNTRINQIENKHNIV